MFSIALVSGDLESMMAETEGGTMCLVCQKVLAYKHDAKRHIKLKHAPSGQPVSCDLCGKSLKHHWALGDHMRKVHGHYAKKGGINMALGPSDLMF